MKGTVLVGLSGGVDSSVSASLLLEAGYEVIGARMRIYDGPGDPHLAYGCYGRDDGEDVRAAENLADRLGIPFHLIDCASLYGREVLDYFRAGYLAGETPNPCIRCNETIKFGAFPRLAQEAGLKFDYLATGHYARLDHSKIDGGPVLRRGLDSRKDQSYFLYRLSRRQLARILFPLGGFTKTEVRAMALERGLAVHDRPDSQDFYGGDYADLLNAPPRPGDIIDAKGRVLGRHNGFWRFTIGQRKGLGVAAAHPLYVLKVVAEKNQVVVGPAAEDAYEGCWIDRLNFLAPPPPFGASLTAKTRSAQSPRPVTIGPRENGRLKVNFAEPQSGLAPGQSLVLYDGDLVVGGGIITAPAD